MVQIAQLAATYPLAFHAIIIFASFLVLVKAANMLVYGIDGYAKRLGLSNYFVGLLVVALTASVPELVSSINGIIEGDAGIIFGTILGSNIAGITLVLGVLALVGRKIKLVNKVLTKMEVILFFMIMLPFLLGADGNLSRVDGGILTFIFFGYAYFLWKRERETGHVRKNVKVKFIWKDGLIFLLALTAMFLSARWLVHSSLTVSKILNVPTYVMAVIIIGIAASLPDMFVGIRAILDGDIGIGIGNALGSMIVKALLFLGIFAMINPLPVDIELLKIAIGVTIFSLAVVMYLSEKKEMNWKHGLFLLLIYIAYITVEALRA